MQCESVRRSLSGSNRHSTYASSDTRAVVPCPGQLRSSLNGADIQTPKVCSLVLYGEAPFSSRAHSVIPDIQSTSCVCLVCVVDVARAGSLVADITGLPIPVCTIAFVTFFSAVCYASNSRTVDTINSALVLAMLGTFLVRPRSGFRRGPRLLDAAESNCDV